MLGRRPPAGLVTCSLLAACGGSSEAPRFDSSDFAVPDVEIETALTFTDVAIAAGVDFVHENGARGDKWMPETVGSGGGFLDYDGDGLPDLFLVNSGSWERGSSEERSRLYRNRGDGTFEDVTETTGIELDSYGMGVAFGDYDGDADTDIYVTAVGTNALLRNDGNNFVNVTQLAGVSGNDPDRSDESWSTGAAWFDYDRNGWIDLIVCNYVRWTPETDLFTTFDGVNKSYATPDVYEGDTCRLYGNNGDGTFTDVTRGSNIVSDRGKSLGVAIADVDDDGWPDVVVANDTEANHLYRNRRNGTFEDIALTVGVGYDEFGRARAGMGVDVARLGEGDLQTIAIGNFSREPVSMYSRVGPDLFTDRAGAYGIASPTLMPLTFGLKFDDFNLDGRLDLILANGHIEPDINAVQQSITFAQRPQLFLHTAEGRFVDFSDLAGPFFGEPIVGRGVATADYDRDGDLDILVTTNGGPAHLLRNDLPADENNWLRLRLRGAPPNHAGIGAAVTVHVRGEVQHRLVRTGSSYLSQSYVNDLLIGLGDAAFADSVLIRWPTGRVEVLDSLVGDVEVREGEGTEGR